jgi:CBS domain-containing protein
MDRAQRPVSEIMQREVVTLAPEETLDLSQDLMRLGRLRHLPVLDSGGVLVGIVSSRDLFEASLARTLEFDLPERRRFLRTIAVADVMTRDVVTLGPDASLADAARVLTKRKIGCLPIVGRDRELLGLVTDTDLIEAAYGDEASPEATTRGGGST